MTFTSKEEEYGHLTHVSGLSVQEELSSDTSEGQAHASIILSLQRSPITRNRDHKQVVPAAVSVVVSATIYMKIFDLERGVLERHAGAHHRRHLDAQPAVLVRPVDGHAPLNYRMCGRIRGFDAEFGLGRTLPA
ncbi:hypothetical protein PtrSN002B_007147 [Pyrenophora tritici-repentis]|uniref:TT-ORF1 domain containing protein n=2 Tax=Pyrenophora tritici-repentis TaxID=45151 RepID=A0A2W1E593_9PLEO|nr:uncharacterized protein PTRG_03147 [Pyrenophora tritici-repentis Pt-1C-BFP]KAF7575130.1 TT-ORF1 domain containing protein [Pyrenophora tritici-repentis]EDU45670.1 predicted protein [Pyrenophora tritici-repentis Pt-1C-BFP]KAG9386101.1 hypothetical protein A1F94_002851 [Pyrenophora tritici-repentis]KAI0574371.1 hypothetical protein Alg215_08627 [Pyrenophora tritici-repentis]KAI0575621.1 hypothetical protein Alg130_09189 [Pyrenophora tritici-repentis]